MLAAGKRPAKSEALIAIARAYAVTGAKLLEVACPEGRCAEVVESCRASLEILAKSPLEEWSLGQVRAAQVKLSRGGGIDSGGEARFSTRADKKASIALGCKQIEESENPVACALRVTRGDCRWSHLLDPQHHSQSAGVPGGWISWSGEGIAIFDAAVRLSASPAGSPR